ncbi:MULTISPECIES: hypothetical protein [unclassified Nocardiopsis]|uniref:hypothetical protein n=1 Tax=Nocardiopsis TaxID=2013 RepID=UPI00387B8859
MDVVTERPYDVNADLGDDLQESDIAETESRMDALYGYNFTENDAEGELGITAEVRCERKPVIPRENWDIDGPGAEAEAVHVITPEGDTDPDPDSAPEDRDF